MAPRKAERPSQRSQPRRDDPESSARVGEDEDVDEQRDDEGMLEEDEEDAPDEDEEDYR